MSVSCVLLERAKLISHLQQKAVYDGQGGTTCGIVALQSWQHPPFRAQLISSWTPSWRWLSRVNLLCECHVALVRRETASRRCERTRARARPVRRCLFAFLNIKLGWDWAATCISVRAGDPGDRVCRGVRSRVFPRARLIFGRSCFEVFQLDLVNPISTQEEARVKLSVSSWGQSKHAYARQRLARKSMQS